jgi:hypothetical protein
MSQVLTKTNRVKEQGHDVPGCYGEHLQLLNSYASCHILLLSIILEWRETKHQSQLYSRFKYIADCFNYSLATTIHWRQLNIFAMIVSTQTNMTPTHASSTGLWAHHIKAKSAHDVSSVTQTTSLELGAHQKKVVRWPIHFAQPSKKEEILFYVDMA